MWHQTCPRDFRDAFPILHKNGNVSQKLLEGIWSHAKSDILLKTASASSGVNRVYDTQHGRSVHHPVMDLFPYSGQGNAPGGGHGDATLPHLTSILALTFDRINKF